MAKLAVLGDAPDADTAGILREGMRALDRIAARAEAEAKASGGGIVRHEPDSDGLDAFTRARVQAFDAAYHAARGCHDDSILPGLRAADAVPDPRREAERRVVEAARVRARTCEDIAVRMMAANALDDALRVLDALDGEAGE